MAGAREPNAAFRGSARLARASARADEERSKSGADWLGPPALATRARVPGSRVPCLLPGWMEGCSKRLFEVYLFSIDRNATWPGHGPALRLTQFSLAQQGRWRFAMHSFRPAAGSSPHRLVKAE